MVDFYFSLLVFNGKNETVEFWKIILCFFKYLTQVHA